MRAELGELPNWRLHDLRRSCRSLLSRIGVAPHVAERILGHRLPGVAKVYDQHSYRDEMGAALKALASLVAKIVKQPNGAPERSRRPFADCQAPGHWRNRLTPC